MRKLKYFSIFFIGFFVYLTPIAFSLNGGLHMFVPTAEAGLSDAVTSGIVNFFSTGFSYIFGTIAAIVGSIINALAYTFLSIAGLLFDTLINYSITNFGNTLSTGGVMPAINMVWAAFRDLANIVIIGMFVFVAFATILDNHTYNIKQFVVKICVVALLLNFSLFFTKAVIDVSNFIAYQFFKGTSSLQVQLQANNGDQPSTGIGIASRLMSSTGITGATVGSNLMSGGKIIFENVGSNFSAVIATSIGLFIFMMLATVILFYGVFQLIYRMVMLIILMMVSALATVAYIIPKFKTYQEQWMSALIQQATFAPLLMMMLWAVTAISDALVGNLNRGATMTLATAMAKPAAPGAMLLFINYFVVCGLLFGAIKLASSLSAKSDGLLFGVGGWMRKQSNSVSEAGFGMAASRIRARRLAGADTELAKAESAMHSATEDQYGSAKAKVDKIKSRISTTGDFRDNQFMKALAKISGVPMGKAEKKTLADDIAHKRKEEDGKVKEMVAVQRGFDAKEKEKNATDEQRSKATRGLTDAIEKLGSDISARKTEQTKTEESHKNLEKQVADGQAEIDKATARGETPSEAITNAQAEKQGALSQAANKIEEIKKEIGVKEKERDALNLKKDAALKTFDETSEARKADAAAKIRKSKESLTKLLQATGVDASDRAVDAGVKILTMDDRQYKGLINREKRDAAVTAVAKTAAETAAAASAAASVSKTPDSGGAAHLTPADHAPAGDAHPPAHK